MKEMFFKLINKLILRKNIPTMEEIWNITITEKDLKAMEIHKARPKRFYSDPGTYEVTIMDTPASDDSLSVLLPADTSLEASVEVDPPKKIVGVVVPVMGNRKYVLGLIPTIRSANHEVKIIVIDNGSKDGITNDLQYMAENGTIAYLEIHPNPLGVACAWNQGIKMSLDLGCDYTVVTNSDMLFHKDMIDQMVTYYDTDDRIILTSATPHNAVLGYTNGFSAKAEDIVKIAERLDAIPIAENPHIMPPDYSCFMITKAYIDEVGYFDENFKGAYYEDNDSHWRISEAGLGAFGTSNAMTLHFGSRSIHEAGYHNRDFSNNYRYFCSKHKTTTTDTSKSPYWSGIEGRRKRPY